MCEHQRLCLPLANALYRTRKRLKSLFEPVLAVRVQYLSHLFCFGWLRLQFRMDPIPPLLLFYSRSTTVAAVGGSLSDAPCFSHVIPLCCALVPFSWLSSCLQLILNELGTKLQKEELELTNKNKCSFVLRGCICSQTVSRRFLIVAAVSFF